jgi:hypothetical protein
VTERGRFFPGIGPLPVITALAVVVLALLAQIRLPLNADAQWILNVAGRMLDGQHLYRDILEINPPLVIWLQIPVVWLARHLGLSPATVYRVGLAAVAVLSTALTFRFFVRSAEGRQFRGRGWVPALLLGVFLILPGGAFGQREQIIGILLLPYVALQALRVERMPVRRLAAIVAGVGAAIAICLKPYFVGTWLLILIYRAVAGRPRRLRVEPEDAAITGVGVGYVAAVLWLAPGFLALASTFAGTYAAYTTMTRSQILLESAAIIWFVVALAAWQVRKETRTSPLGTLLVLVAVGAIAAAVWQGKGWTYHFLPAVMASVLLGALALSAPASVVRSRVHSLARAVAAVFVLVSWVPLAAGVAGQLTTGGHASDAQAEVEARELRAAVSTEDSARSILVLTSDMTGTQPWIGEQRLASRNSWSCLWVPAVVYHTRWNGNPRVALRTASEMSGAERTAYASVVQDLTADPPDLLVVETRAKNERFTGYPGGFDHLAYYGADPRFGACLKQYRLDAVLSGFLVYRRLPAGMRSGGCA